MDICAYLPSGWAGPDLCVELMIVLMILPFLGEAAQMKILQQFCHTHNFYCSAMEIFCKINIENQTLPQGSNPQ